MKGLKDLVCGDFKADNISTEDLSQLQVQWYNESIGNMNEEDGIECDICKNKGYIQYLDGHYQKIKECSCMKKRKQLRRAKKSGLGSYITKRSSDFKVTEQWQVEMYEKMFSYCSTPNNNWFCALGTSGCGKTLLCSIIANHLLLNLGKSVQYITWTDFISQLKRDMMSDATESANSTLHEIKNVEVLFIDELLKKYNETDLKYIIEIINYRYTNNLVTLVTSEKTMDELLDIDEASFSRLIEKCESFVINIAKDRNKNQRLKGLKR